MKILLAAFEPFGEHTANASAEVAARLTIEGVEGVDLVTLVLPTVRFTAFDALLDAFEREQPDAVVMLGIAADRAAVTPERVAINVDDYRIPDNAGNQPVDEPVVEGAPLAYLSTLPIKWIVSELESRGIAAKVSNSAGTYLCNHVSYALLHHAECSKSPCRIGFLHIPQMSEAAKPDAPCLPLETLVEAVRAAIEVVARGGHSSPPQSAE